MQPSLSLRLLRDGLAVAVVAAFLFPLFWWGLTSIKPGYAILDQHRIVIFDFTPTWDNYAVTLAGAGPASFASRASLANTAIVALGSTAITLAAALPLGFALSVFTFRFRRSIFYWVLFQRFLPPIAIIVPLVFTYHADRACATRCLGVILAHAALNLPFAVLLLKSFFDDVPREVGEAAVIDGASRLQVFARIATPMIRGGIAATAVLCLIFSWTEFLMSLFLTSDDPHVPGAGQPRCHQHVGLHLGPQHGEHAAGLRVHPAGAAPSGPRADHGPDKGLAFQEHRQRETHGCIGRQCV